MAETVQGLTITVEIRGIVNGTDGAQLVVDESNTYVFSNGTGEDQVGYVWQDKARSLDTTTEDLNLDGLTDFQGATMTTNNNVAVMYIKNLDTDTGDRLVLGGAAANQMINWVQAANDQINIGADGLFLLISPLDKYAITAATGDLLRVEAVDTSTYDILIAGDNA